MNQSKQGKFEIRHTAFTYDATSSQGFKPDSLIRMHGDTAEINDYFPMAQVGDLTADVSVAGNTLVVSYHPGLGPVNDWMPTMAVKLWVVLRPVPDSMYIRFTALEDGRKPTAGEIGFRDGTQPKTVKVGLRGL